MTFCKIDANQAADWYAEWLKNSWNDGTDESKKSQPLGFKAQESLSIRETEAEEKPKENYVPKFVLGEFLIFTGYFLNSLYQDIKKSIFDREVSIETLQTEKIRKGLGIRSEIKKIIYDSLRNGDIYLPLKQFEHENYTHVEYKLLEYLKDNHKEYNKDKAQGLPDLFKILSSKDITISEQFWIILVIMSSKNEEGKTIFEGLKDEERKNCLEQYTLEKYSLNEEQKEALTKLIAPKKEVSEN